ncbi:serine/threonine phosphatase [Chlorogloeopsis sp. ULAP02]|uniref:serine/threonine phosphatase n=1 Tax=Chlorogloeopsis sp. ULAP02 TaxID=3107926 RepID=UPI003135565C
MAKVALLIGVSEYDEPSLNPLPAAVQDIKAIQRVLQHPDMGGFAEADIKVLENPQRQAMEEAIEAIFSSRRRDDLVLLFFSGYGIKDDIGRLYLATRQTRKNNQGELVKTSATAANLIHDVMENSRSRKQVIILDCCFSGAFGEGMRAKDDGSLDIKNQLVETKNPEEVEGRAVLTSSTATQYSFEQQGSELSVYTRYLVEGIEKGAADTDNDGVISVDELHEYARKKVQEAAPAMKPGIFAVREGYKIQLAKAPKGDPKVEYRKEVERCVREGQIFLVGRRILKRRQSELGVSAEDAIQIENEVLEPYRERQRNLQEYEEALTEALQHEGILSQQTREELKRLQQILLLRDEDIASIESDLGTGSKAVNQQKFFTIYPTILQLDEPEEDIARKSDDLPTVMLPMQLISLEHAGLTDVGRQRHHNEDDFGIDTKINNLEFPNSRDNVQARALYILCDGMGGHAGGEVASALAVNTVRQYFKTHWITNELPTEDQILEAVRQTNQAIYDVNQQDARSGIGRMGTTLVMLLIQNTQAAVAHVGDSRLYRVTRKGGLEQLTVDHEVGQREISRGVEPSVAYARPDAYQLTQALGPRDENFIIPDVTFFEISEDSLFVLTSDGLSDNNLLETHWQTHLLPLLSSGVNLEDGIRNLIDLANNYNGHDNITVVLVRAKVRPNLNSSS